MLSFVQLFLLLALGILALLAAHWGLADASTLLDVGTTLFCLATLGAILGLPWDLYYEARRLALEQDESTRRGITIPPEDRDFAAGSAPRLLLLCLGLHAGAALLVAGATSFSGGRIGYYFAVFFLVSTIFRPLGAFYSHMKARLVELRERARYPREDAVSLRDRVERLEAFAEQVREEAPALRERLDGELAGFESRLRELQRQLGEQHAAFDAKVDQVCREFTRSLERLTEDKELLHGMRAFVRMVKEA